MTREEEEEEGEEQEEGGEEEEEEEEEEEKEKEKEKKRCEGGMNVSLCNTVNHNFSPPSHLCIHLESR